ncbi:hypothetical protein OU789_16300 [Halocynthiibacter sp. C4]|uniref:ShlB/FhaC/HecB family hemolysin secretion/activation protein n=1 Tax=Halocynthiibacter sp. C4 TaxID=2992758 RepID=UPI00237C377F|nr:ShlB/FhaC/HecB family hemolysin secretion/activation protein [Halocynthiibacter sp. C4]MDE0591501.1 hypothetical protein [Halocynthiibacter sp. C4]
MMKQVFRVCAIVLAMACALPAAAQSFRLEGISVGSSSYLDEAEINRVTQKYIKRNITFDDLQTMIGELNALYTKSGVPTAQAVLPPQEITNGILEVSLVEASISEVVFEGFDSTNPGFLRSTLALDAGIKPDFDALEHDLLLYDIAHDISPRLTFEAGEEAGTTRAIVTAEEPERYSFTTSVDNFGREETGVARLTLFGRMASMTGVRDTLSVQAQKSSGASSASASYSRPVGTEGGRVIAAASFSRSGIIGGDFQGLRVISDYASASLSFRQPVWVQTNQYTMLEFGSSLEATSSTITGKKFADVDLWDVFAQARYLRRTAHSTLGFSAGMRAGNSEALGTSLTEGDFWLLYGDALYGRNLGKSVTFNGNINFQLAPGENLPVARVFTAGGIGSVRGYPSNIRAGDSGAVVNLQLSKSTPYRPDSLPKLDVTPFGFVDMGLVVPYRLDGGVDMDRDFIASIGGGATAKYGDHINVFAVLGVPLRNTLGFYNKGDPDFYLGLDYAF